MPRPALAWASPCPPLSLSGACRAELCLRSAPVSAYLRQVTSLGGQFPKAPLCSPLPLSHPAAPSLIVLLPLNLVYILEAQGPPDSPAGDVTSQNNRILGSLPVWL